MVAEGAREALGLGTVLFVPARTPPHKPHRILAGPEHRAAMLALAVAGNRAFEISRLELDAPGPSYTVDTLRALRARYGDGAELVLVLGFDSLAELSTWREPDVIERLARFAVARRPGAGEGAAPSAAAFSNVLEIPSPSVAISSTEIRARVAAGRSIRYLVPEAVRAYIGTHGLYRA